jgi:SulP family sulfate permease
MLSLILYLRRTSRPAIVSMVPDPAQPARRMVNTNRTEIPECPQLKTARIDGSLFFGAVDHVAHTLQSICESPPKQNHLLLIANGINFIDAAGAEALVAEAKRLHEQGGGLYISGAKAAVREILVRGGYIDEIGQENMFASKADAIRHIVPKLDAGRCAECTRRIFKECPAPAATTANG